MNDYVYDLGMNNGDDTAFYLACGLRVLAIEADPDLVAAAAKRFKVEIEAKRLTILNVGVAEHDTTGEFWINEVISEWNSFSRELTGRAGHPIHPVIIPCRRLDSIIAEYGMPFYIKIDIEGYDIVCCEQLSPTNKPAYISVEATRIDLLLKLRDLGYSGFKFVWQDGLYPAELRDPSLSTKALWAVYRQAQYRLEDRSLPMRLRRASASVVVKAAAAFGYTLRPATLKPRRLPEWKFNYGSAGTFGDDLPGEWLNFDDTAYIWFREFKRHQTNGTEFWYDLHAKASPDR